MKSHYSTACFLALFFSVIALSALRAQEPELRWIGAEGGINSFFWIEPSPDGRTLATKSELATVHLRDAETGRVRIEAVGGESIYGSRLLFTKDGKHLAAVFPGGCDIISVDSGTTRSFVIAEGQIIGAFFIGEGTAERLIVAWAEGYIRAYDYMTGTEVKVVGSGKVGAFNSVSAINDRTQVVIGSTSGQVHFWNPYADSLDKEHSFSIDYTMSGTKREGRILAFSSSNTLFAAHGDDGAVDVWDTRSNRRIITIELEDLLPPGVFARYFEAFYRSPWGSAALSPMGDTLFLHSDIDGTIYVIDVVTGNELNAFPDGFNYSHSPFRADSAGLNIERERMTYDAESRSLFLVESQIFGDEDHARWENHAGRISVESGDVVEYTIHDAAVSDVAVLPGGTVGRSIARETFIEWNLKDGTRRETRWMGGPLFAFSVMSPTGESVMSLYWDWDADRNPLRQIRVEPGLGVIDIPMSDSLGNGGKQAVSPGGTYAFIGNRIYREGGAYFSIDIHPSWVEQVEFTGDGRYLVILANETISVWNVAENRHEQDIEPVSRPEKFCLDQDGTTMAILLQGGRVIVVDLDTWESTYEYSVHEYSTAIAFDDAGTSILTAAYDSTMTVHYVPEERDVVTFKTPGVVSAISAAGTGSEEKLVMVGMYTGAVALWRADESIVGFDERWKSLRPVPFELR